jgi:hypothetical protein
VPQGTCGSKSGSGSRSFSWEAAVAHPVQSRTAATNRAAASRSRQGAVLLVAVLLVVRNDAVLVVRPVRGV